ncbi:hypothetical protein ACEQUB_03230 [Ralstonia syzygii]
MTQPEATPPSARTRVRRVAQRGHYDRATLYAIIDAAYVCHLAFADTPGYVQRWQAQARRLDAEAVLP